MKQTRTFLLPDLGEGLTESEIVSWRIAVGDEVTLNQIIAEVETAKAIVELPAPYTGTITRIYALPGVSVNVGEPLIDVELVGASDAGAEVEGSGEVSAEHGTVAGQPDSESSHNHDEGARSADDELTDVIEVQPNLVGYGAQAESDDGPARRARRRLPTEAIDIISPAVDRVRAAPPVRKLAHELGIDLNKITGSGEDGVVVRADVEAAFAERFDAAHTTSSTSGAASAVTTQSEPDGSAVAENAVETSDASHDGVATESSRRETRIAIHGVRKRTAAAMVQSAFTAPQVSCFLTVDVGASTQLLAELQAEASANPAVEQQRIGILALTAQAVCLAALRTPEINSHWDDAAGEIVQYHYVNLGIAAATPRGLLVPVIEDAHTLSLRHLAAAIADLAGTARAGTTAPAQLRGGTFTISNIGVFGIDAGTPILNPGEAGILALGAVRREPREWNGEIALRDVLTLSLTFDHRLVDGEQGARFLADVGAVLHNPARALAMM